MKNISNIKIRKLFGYYDFDIVFQDNSLILIGENGSGKTTIMNMLFYFITKQWDELVTMQFDFISLKIVGYAQEMVLTHKELSEYMGMNKERFFLFSKSKEAQRLTKNLNEVSSVLNSVFKNSFILYLPTFRRIENKNQVVEKIGDGLPHFHDEENEQNYKMLKEFGMDDVYMQNVIYSSRLKDNYVKSLNSLNKKYLNDILVGSYEDDAGLLLKFSRDKIVSVIDAIDSHLLSKSNKDKLKTFFSKASKNNEGESNDREKILSHYLYLLLNSQLEIQKQRISMNFFLSMCNKYLHGKQLLFDENELTYKLYNEFKNELALDTLSSGEKQIVSIFSYLCLASDKSVFVMIDEPELSLSVEWQRRILEDIKKCPSCKGLFAVTHSPFVIGEHIRGYARGIGEFRK